MPPISRLGAGLISGGMNILGDLFGLSSNAVQNRRSEAFQREMYDKKLADDRRLWSEANEYNSPSAQMKRLQAAGVNPRLAVGNGSGLGGSNVSPVNSPDVGSPQFRPTEFSGVRTSGMDFIGQYIDTEVKQAQVDNFKADNFVKQMQALLVGAQTKATLTGEERSRFDLGLEKSLAEVTANFRKEQLRQVTTSINIDLQDNVRQWISSGLNFKEVSERIKGYAVSRAKTRAEIRQINDNLKTSKLQRELMNFEKDLMKNGIDKNSPWYIKLFSNMIEGKLPVKDVEKLPNRYMDKRRKPDTWKDVIDHWTRKAVGG